MEDSWEDIEEDYYNNPYPEDSYDYDSYGDSWEAYLPEDEDSWD